MKAKDHKSSEGYLMHYNLIRNLINILLIKINGPIILTLDTNPKAER